MSALAGEVDVPGVGKVRKGYAAAGVAVVGVLAVVWWRNRKASSASSASSTAAATDPTAATADTTYQPGTDYSGGGGGGGDTSTSTQVDNGPPFTTNAAWLQYATNWLVNTVGLPAGDVSAALGAYLSGSKVTVAQRDIINQATGAAGAPPVTGANGYPPSINLASPPSGGSGGTTTPPPSGGSGGTTTPPPSGGSGGTTPPPPPAPVGHWVDHVGPWPAWNSTLSGIAAYRSKPGAAGTLYSANRDAIEAAAHAHGHSSSNNGSLLFTGTAITIPWLDAAGHHLY